jgi:lipid-binding SYLF domain-containing protein
MLLAAGSLLAGCAHAPKTAAEKASLVDESNRALDKMVANDPSLRQVIDQSAGFVVFPRVVEMGFVAGGGYGKGVIYEGGRPIGYATLNEGMVGATIGGHTYAELIVARDGNALTQIKNGRYHFGGQTAAVAVKSGVAGETMFDKGVAVSVQPEAGGMLNLSLAGQRIKVTM